MNIIRNEFIIQKEELARSNNPEALLEYYKEQYSLPVGRMAIELTGGYLKHPLYTNEMQELYRAKFIVVGMEEWIKFKKMVIANTNPYDRVEELFRQMEEGHIPASADEWTKAAMLRDFNTKF